MDRENRVFKGISFALLLLTLLMAFSIVSFANNNDVAMVSAGFHTAILKKDGSLWMCGSNYSGQIGDGTTTDRSTPVQVMTGVASVSVGGGDQTAIVKQDGSLWMCGGNYSGQLGDDTTTERHTPVQIMTGVAAVSAGGSHTAILKKDGSLWMCGYNGSGQLGDGIDLDNGYDTDEGKLKWERHTPVQVMTGVASVSAGCYHTAIVKKDGSLWMCGDNYRGQLGDGTTTNKSTPVQIMTGVASVSAGFNYTAILKKDGSLWMCGGNGDGELGDGTTTSYRTPVQVMTGVASVSAGYSHTAIVKKDGSLWMCGRNEFGQLGDGTETDRHTPVQIMTGVASVSARYDYTAIVKKDGSLWMCGHNYFGRLGDGTETDRHTPVKIVFTPTLTLPGFSLSYREDNYRNINLAFDSKPEGIDGIEVEYYNCTTKERKTKSFGLSELDNTSGKNCLTLSRLENGSKYTVRARAYTNNEYGEWSEEQSISFTEKLLPSDKGITKTVGSVEYKVTNVSGTNGEVAITSLKSKNAATVKIPATIKISGTTLKVTAIGKNAFKNMKKLKTVSMGKYVKSIGTSAFSGCKALTKVTIGSNVTSIGASAFYGCTKLKTIVIPAKVTKIGKNAFYGDKQLKTITIRSSKLKTVGANALKGINAKATIKVPGKKLKTYTNLLKKKGIGKKVKIA